MAAKEGGREERKEGGREEGYLPKLMLPPPPAPPPPPLHLLLLLLPPGLLPCPVIAVPTSVGYGVGKDGLAPLLTMLNACAPGVACVNIDNGIGAAGMVVKILRVRHRG